MTPSITCKTCGAEMAHHTDYIAVQDKAGAFLGNIYSADPAEDWNKITGGACPICNEWEDGNGHICTAGGWAQEHPSAGKKE